MFINVYDMARFGYLFLRNGKWKDRQIVSEKWMRWRGRPGRLKRHVRLRELVLNTAKAGAGAPATAYVHGDGANTIYVDWENDLVIVTRWADGLNDLVGKTIESLRSAGVRLRGGPLSQNRLRQSSSGQLGRRAPPRTTGGFGGFNRKNSRFAWFGHETILVVSPNSTSCSRSGAGVRPLRRGRVDSDFPSSRKRRWPRHRLQESARSASLQFRVLRNRSGFRASRAGQAHRPCGMRRPSEGHDRRTYYAGDVRMNARKQMSRHTPSEVP